MVCISWLIEYSRYSVSGCGVGGWNKGIGGCGVGGWSKGIGECGVGG